MSVSLLLLFVALVLFVLAAISWPRQPRVNLVAAGLACWVLATMLGSGALHG